MRNFFPEPRNRVKNLKVRRQGKGTEGMELKLYFVTSLLSLTLPCFCVSESFVGKVLDLITDLILLGKWPRSLSVVQRALFTCFSLLFSNCELATFQLGKLKIVGTTSFLSTS